MLRTLITLALTATFATKALACQVPVFRYALERWKADKYRLQVLHKEPSLKLQPQEHANLTVEYFNADKLTDAQEWSIVGLDQVNTYPSHILTAPTAMNIQQPILIQKTNKKNWKSLTQSPVRQAIIKKLLAGDSAVFLHLLSGDKAKDAETRKLLEATLKKAQETIELPEGIINPDEVAEAQAEGEIDFDDVLRSEIPLKIAFSIVSLDPNDPAEQDFIKILLNGNTIEQLPEPSLVAPIFGRGRCLALMPASSLTEKTIIGQCQYLCAACACSVKNENPGFDILLTANWDEKLINSTAIVEKSIPELTGAGDFLSTKDVTTPVAKELPPVIQTLPKREKNFFSLLTTTVKILIGSAVLALILGSLYFYKKSQANSPS